MAARFIIGRAGSGKTHHCLEAIRERIRLDPIDGPRLILLVPEQAALQTERAILAPADIAAAHRAEVLSFQRLAYRVLESTGAEARRALTDASRTMVLRHLVGTLSPQLRYYRRVEQMTGFLDRLAAALRELIQEAIEPDELRAAAQASGTSDSLRGARFHDLALIYQVYRDYLGDTLLDPSMSLQLARERMPSCAWLDGAEIWVDGFASMMRQESLTLVELARRAQRVEITLLADPLLCGSDENAVPGRPDASVFARTRRTFERLQQSLDQAGVAIEEPLLLQHDCSPRFRANPALSRLEQKLFQAPARDVALQESFRYNGIEYVKLPTRREEAEWAATRIARWKREPGYRYRDLAVMVRDLELYHDLLSAALASRGIPFFIDRRRSTAHHPIVELLRSAMTLTMEDFSSGAVLPVLKTGLIGLSEDAADELENYLLAQDINGFAAWSGGDWLRADAALLPPRRESRSADAGALLARVNRARVQVAEAFREWMKATRGVTALTGPAWVEVIRSLLDTLTVSACIESWASEAEARGDADLAAEHRQVWADLHKFLDDLAFAFESTPLPLDEWHRVLEAGLAGFTLGLTPPTLDEVLVGSMDRSRHPEIKAAILLGFNDGVFPHEPTEDAMFTDADREALEAAGVSLGFTSRERAADEAMLAYIAVTRASEALVITSSLRDEDGRELRPSPFLRDIRAALAISENAVSDAEPDPLWPIWNRRDLVRNIPQEFRSRTRQDSPDVDRRRLWNTVYEEWRTELAGSLAGRLALCGLDERDRSSLTTESVARLYPQTLRASVSQLESYAACPFKHFAEHTLRLSKRETARLEPRTLGEFQHAVLEEFVRVLAQSRRAMAGLTDEELKSQLCESCGRVAGRMSDAGLLQRRRSRHLLQRAAADVARAARVQRWVSSGGRFRPAAVELPFGFEDRQGLPALELSTPKGRRVCLRGFMDRVDWVEAETEALASVVDYKRTRDKKLTLGEVYYGLTLQLLGYLLVLVEHGKRLTGKPTVPAAALYVSLARKYKSDDADDDKNKASLFDGSCKPRGLIHWGFANQLDEKLTSGRSDYFSLHRKEDGDIGYPKQSDAVTAEQFEALLALTRRKLGELADGVLDGRIAVQPYRLGGESPCKQCLMKSVCRFEIGLYPVRWLESMSRSDVLARLSGNERSTGE